MLNEDNASKPVSKEELGAFLQYFILHLVLTYVAAHAKAIENAIHAPAPSCVAHNPKMLKAEQDQRPIYNGRPAGRTGPPITVYHQSFAKLKAALRDPTTVVDEARENRLRNTVKLHGAATNIYDSEDERCKEVIPHLERLLNIDLIRKRTVHIDKRAVTPDAIAEEAVDGAETKAVIALVEFKNEFGGGDCGLQTALRLRKYLALDAVCNFVCHNFKLWSFV